MMWERTAKQFFLCKVPDRSMFSPSGHKGGVLSGGYLVMVSIHLS